MSGDSLNGDSLVKVLLLGGDNGDVGDRPMKRIFREGVSEVRVSGFNGSVCRILDGPRD